MKVISDINQTEIILKIIFYPGVAYLRSLNGCLIGTLSSLNHIWGLLYRSVHKVKSHVPVPTMVQQGAVFSQQKALNH